MTLLAHARLGQGAWNAEGRALGASREHETLRAMGRVARPALAGGFLERVPRALCHGILYRPVGPKELALIAANAFIPSSASRKSCPSKPASRKVFLTIIRIAVESSTIIIFTAILQIDSFIEESRSRLPRRTS